MTERSEVTPGERGRRYGEGAWASPTSEESGENVLGRDGADGQAPGVGDAAPERATSPARVVVPAPEAPVDGLPGSPEPAPPERPPHLDPVILPPAALAAPDTSATASVEVAGDEELEEPPPRLVSRNPVDRLTRRFPRPVRVVLDWLVTIIGAIAIVLLVKAYVVNPYRIPSSSMEPTLHCAEPAVGCEARFSDRVLANRFIYHLRDPRRGDIIVFETPEEAQLKCGAGGTFVKRIVGLPGETIEVKLQRGDGFVYIDGEKLDEPYIELERRLAGSELKPTKIPADSYFVMGDNRAQSCDSRVWGSVPRDNLIGKVFATYWPPQRISIR